jgi:hypothetical protein
MAEIKNTYQLGTKEYYLGYHLALFNDIRELTYCRINKLLPVLVERKKMISTFLAILTKMV